MADSLRIFPAPARLLAAVFLFCLLGVAAELSPETVARIERVISSEMAARRIPALSIAIGVGDGEIWARGYGFADLENFVPATARSVYRIASISKPITAVAAMQLVEEGKLSLEDEASAGVTEFPAKRWPVRLRQLLGHQGGVRSYAGPHEVESTRRYDSVRAGLAMFAADPLAHEPETKYLYSSYGFNLAGAMVETAAGQPFIDYLERRVFAPAGMKETRDDSQRVLIPRRVNGYRKNAEGAIENCALADTSNKIPGGGMVSTAPDLVRFGRAVLGGKLVSAESRKRMFTEQMLRDGKGTGYGMGWNISRLEDLERVGHGGSQPGTNTYLDLIPERGIVVAILTNLEGAQPKTISDRIVRVLAGLEEPAP